MSPQKENALAGEPPTEQSLKQIANCLAYLVVNSGELKDKPNQEKMSLLDSLGFERQIIASIFQTSPEVVKQSLYLVRSSKKSSRGKRIKGSVSNDGAGVSHDGANQPGTTEETTE